MKRWRDIFGRFCEGFLTDRTNYCVFDIESFWMCLKVSGVFHLKKGKSRHAVLWTMLRGSDDLILELLFWKVQ